MSVLLLEQIIHPTYLRLLCLDVRRRGVSLADALGGTGIPARDAECYRVGSDPWAVCTRVQDCGEQGGDSAARGTIPCRGAKRGRLSYGIHDRDVGCRADLAALGAVVTIKRFGRKKLKRRPNNQSPVEEWMRLASVSLRTARYHIQKGIVETILAPAGTGKNRRLRRMILWKPSDKTQALLSIACCKRSSRIEMIS